MQYLIAILAAAFLVACGEKPPEQTNGEPAPAPAAAPNNTAANMLLGGALGYMLGSSNRPVAQPAPAPQVIERTHVRVIERQVAAPPPPPPKPPVVATPAAPIVREVPKPTVAPKAPSGRR